MIEKGLNNINNNEITPKQEFLDIAHIEIVHVDQGMLEQFEQYSDKDARTAERIKGLDKTKTLNYVLGGLNDDIPNIPKDTPIAVGGGEWNVCVKIRVKNLKKAGFTNVRAVKAISF